MNIAMAEDTPPPISRARKLSSEAPSAKAKEMMPPQMNTRATQYMMT